MKKIQIDQKEENSENVENLWTDGCPGPTWWHIVSMTARLRVFLGLIKI